MVVIGTSGAAPSAKRVTPPLVPAFLAGRFGNDAELWLVAPVEARMLEPGSLIHRSSGDSNPQHAVGVVLQATDKGAIALIARQQPHTLSLRDHSRAIAIRLIAPYVEGMDLAAALGGNAGAA
jgi:sarcosine oxidase subunit alpha